LNWFAFPCPAEVQIKRPKPNIHNSPSPPPHARTGTSQLFFPTARKCEKKLCQKPDEHPSINIVMIWDYRRGYGNIEDRVVMDTIGGGHELTMCEIIRHFVGCDKPLR